MTAPARTRRPRHVVAYEKRWRLDRERGIDRSFVPTAPVRAHIDRLLASGMTNAHVAELARVSPTTIGRTRDETYTTMQRRVAARILAVQPTVERQRRSGFVPAEGARRRIRALLAMGWTHEQMLARSGVRTAVALHQAGPWISARKHVAIARLYDALSMTPGPSRRTRDRSARLGYLPPLAWDDETIDDPQAGPATANVDEVDDVDEVAVMRARHGDLRGAPKAVVDETVLQLTREGLSAVQIAARLGISDRTVTRARAAASPREVAS